MSITICETGMHNVASNTISANTYVLNRVADGVPFDSHKITVQTVCNGKKTVGFDKDVNLGALLALLLNRVKYLESRIEPDEVTFHY